MKNKKKKRIRKEAQKKSHVTNRLERQKRREKQIANRPAPYKKTVELIDGNYSRYPVGYCIYHGGFMTRGLMDTHRCEKRSCPRLVPRSRFDEIDV